MKNRIIESLRQLIGFEFTRTTRMGAMECLKFGVLFSTNRKGQEVNIGEFGLHLQCPWRFTEKNIILVGNCDLCEQPDEFACYDENFEWDKENMLESCISSFIF